MFQEFYKLQGGELSAIMGTWWRMLSLVVLANMIEPGETGDRGLS